MEPDFCLLPLCYTKREMTTFLSTMSPLALIVLLMFLFAIALVVALWSLLTFSSSPRALAVVRAPRVKVKRVAAEPKPLRSNRFMKPALEAEVEEEEVISELPTNHVSRSRVRILKTLEPDPELETPAFKPTTYDQMVNRQRVPKTDLPKANLPRTGLPTDLTGTTASLNTGLPKPAREVAAPKTSLREANRTAPEPIRPRPLQPSAIQPSAIQQPLNVPTQAPTPLLRNDGEDTSTQPSLFEANRKRPQPSAQQQNPVRPESVQQGLPPRDVPPRQTPLPQPALKQPAPRQPSVQREESEAAFRASQSAEPAKPKTQKEKEEAFENFLRKNDDLGF
jgi:hypothetical protein